MTYVVVAVFLGAVSAMIAVAVSVFRHDPARGRKPFPWFWIAFPVAATFLACLAALFMTGLTMGDYGWTMYAPLTDADSSQYSSNGQFTALGWNLRHNVAAWFLAGSGVVAGTLASVVAWRKGRI